MDNKIFHPCDEALMATNDDASECKRCAVRVGEFYIYIIIRFYFLMSI